MAQPQGLDDFGARFDSSAMGRFMSPDWANKPEPVPYAKLTDPQSLNLYAFAQNNPESAPDLDGHHPQDLWDGDGPHQRATFCDFGISADCDAFENDDCTPLPPDSDESSVVIWNLFGGAGGGQQTNSQAFQSVWDAYPTHEAYGYGDAGTSGQSIQQLTGVDVVDTCALRMSYALNQAGFTISKSDGKSAMQGANGQYYLVSQKDVGNFITKTFGISPQQIGKAGVADFESNFAGQNGFVRFDIQFNHAGNTATGHVALWNGANFHEWQDRYTIPAPDGGYVVKGIQFWGMQ